ncbi:NAD(P)-dependent oxidoreductase [Neptuniibacter caesariensis]|uniref:NAD(P)-binding domain-containing protein n=1 Tax=Neptuniibacter caesariensis TaxID=207954 RepID=A0A7U8C565_NEPCE|nr:NAD(P)-dependent oxidoreductase [Neptuniibacter caesariensis]EAR61785.1 hypothetical protein MED92_04282 [Neptuniibacter caesariensis]
MKIAILGVTGWIGSHIAVEAKGRGHEVIGLVRNTTVEVNHADELRAFDLLDADADLKAALDGADLLVSAVGGRAAGNHQLVVETAEKLLSELPETSVNRLLWVGGAGSLEVAPGVKLMTVPDFPEEYKDEALAMGEALQVFRNKDTSVNWTFISPAAEIYPGEKQGAYRVTGDSLLTDADGNSRISVSDYALAMVDELEKAQYPQQRIGVAY